MEVEDKQSDSFLIKIWCQNLGCVGLKEPSTPVCFFSKDVLKQFMLLCSLGNVLPVLQFCEYFYLTGS